MYRVQGREADPEVVPAPPTRTLLSPLGWGLVAVVFLVLPVSVANVVLQSAGDDPTSSTPAVRLVPWVDTFELVIGLAVLGTFLVLVAQVVRRVAPQWSGISMPAKVLYLVALLAGQGIFVVGGEATLFQTHGGLELFGPSLQATIPGPDGKTAYVYSGGLLSCRLELFVANRPISPTMHRVQSVSGRCTNETPPNVSWGSDGSVHLVDLKMAPLVDQPSKPFFFAWGGGC